MTSVSYIDAAIFSAVGFAQHSYCLYFAGALGSVYGFFLGRNALVWGRPAGVTYFVSSGEPDLNYRMFSSNIHAGIDRMLRMILLAILLYHIDGSYHWQSYIATRWLMGLVAVLFVVSGVLTGRYLAVAFVCAFGWLSLEYQGMKWGRQEGKDYIVRTVMADRSVDLFPFSREELIKWERECVAFSRDNLFLQGCYAALWLGAAVASRWWLTEPTSWLARDSGDFGAMTIWLVAHDAVFLTAWILTRWGVRSIALFLKSTMDMSIYYTGAQFITGAMVKPMRPTFAPVAAPQPPGGRSATGAIKAAFVKLKRKIP